MLTKFGHLDPNGSIHFTCVMITFLNSCVNPFLYGIYSPAFRAEYKDVFRYYYRKTVNAFQHSNVKPSCEQEQGNSLSEKAVSDKSNSSYSANPASTQNNTVTLRVEEEQGNSVSVKFEYNHGYAFTEKPESDRESVILKSGSNQDRLPNESVKMTRYANTSM
jgi:hypothetical protein